MILNHTPFGAEVLAGWDQDLCPYYAVVLTAILEAPLDQEIRVSETKPESLPGDVFFGEPDRSSVRYEADIAPEKPRVDVIVNGQAHAGARGKATRLAVGLKIGDVAKTLMVSGDRVAGSGERPFSTMPIVYERAYGGSRPDRPGSADPRNPVGVGHHRARSADPKVDTDLPNIEYPDGRADPAGFGIVARQWQPRLAWAGTYDDRWMEDRCPLLPADFNPVHHQAAPPDQQSSTIRGGELVEVVNMTPEGLWRFHLPKLTTPVRFWYADRGHVVAPRLDTILLEPDEYRITLKARIKVRMLRNRAPIRQIIVGHVTDGWWRSRLSGKRYFDSNGLSGRKPNEPDYLT